MRRQRNKQKNVAHIFKEEKKKKKEKKRIPCLTKRAVFESSRLVHEVLITALIS